LRGGQRDIFTMRPDGSGLTNITHDANDEDRDPVWSPDGRRIAFTHNSGGGDYDIYLMNADGTGRVNVTNDPTMWTLNPTWSPDGTRLAYNTLQNSSSTIEIIGVDGAGRVSVGPGVHPSWSPDGAWLAFLGKGPSGASGIVIARPDGSDSRLLNSTTATDLDPIWSPDGKELAYVSNSHLAVIGADGANRRVLPDLPEADHRFPAWSPDGQYIVYTRTTPGPITQVYVVGRALGAVRQITADSVGVPGAYQNYQPTWGIDPH
jgi:TolB protein